MPVKNRKVSRPPRFSKGKKPFYQRSWFGFALILAAVLPFAGSSQTSPVPTKAESAGQTTVLKASVQASSQVLDVQERIRAMHMPEQASTDEQQAFSTLQKSALEESGLSKLQSDEKDLQALIDASTKRIEQQKADSESLARAQSEEAARQASEEAARQASEEAARQASEEAARQASEEAAAQEQQRQASVQAEQQAAAAQAALQEQASAPQAFEEEESSAGHMCKDGTPVSSQADPHAKGRANACYGHKGFAY